MTFLVFVLVLSGSTDLLHPPPPLYGLLLSNNKDENLLKSMFFTLLPTQTHVCSHQL